MKMPIPVTYVTEREDKYLQNETGLGRFRLSIGRSFSFSCTITITGSCNCSISGSGGGGGIGSSYLCIDLRNMVSFR